MGLRSEAATFTSWELVITRPRSEAATFRAGPEPDVQLQLQTFAEMYYYAQVWKLHLCGAHMYTRVNKQECLMSNYRTSWNCVRLGSEAMTHHVSPLFTEHSFYQTLVVQLWLVYIHKHVFMSMWNSEYCTTTCQCWVLHISFVLWTTSVLLWVLGLYLSSFITSALVAVLVVKTDIMASSLGKSWAYQHEEIHSPSWVTSGLRIVYC